MQTPLKITVAKTFLHRFRGLMLSQPLAKDHALLILHCASVHTFFMRYALDLVYLDKDARVVHLARNIQPWRMSWGARGATQTLEMTAGGIDHYFIRIGDQLNLPTCMALNS